MLMLEAQLQYLGYNAGYNNMNIYNHKCII